MAMFPKTSSAIIGFGIREGTAMLVDAVLGRPSRPRRVLDYIRSKTNPGDPVAVLEFSGRPAYWIWMSMS